MKLLVVFVSIAITFCVAASHKHNKPKHMDKDNKTLLELTQRISEIIRKISVDVTTALSEEVNDLVMNDSPLPAELHDVITKLKKTKNIVTSAVKIYVEQVYSELVKLEAALKAGEYLNVHPIIQSIHSHVTVLKSKIH